jgi:hypothetical protein
MAAIVKANPTLTAGGLVVIRRNFSTSDRGQVTYEAEYVCLSQFANNHAGRFRSGAEPPTPIPAAMLLLNITRTPTLVDLVSQTNNGITTFNATYAAGVQTDLVITRTSETRSVSWQVIRDNSPTITQGFDYISNSVTATGTNQEIPVIKGSTGRVFNGRNINLFRIIGNELRNVTQTTVESTRQVSNARGEYENSVTSTGIYEAVDSVPIGRISASETTPTAISLPPSFQFQRQTQNIRT